MKKDVLGKRIRQMRRARQITGKEMASRMGISAAAVSKLERGLLRPTSELVAKVISALDLQSVEARALQETEAFFNSQFRRWSTTTEQIERNQHLIGQREVRAKSLRCYMNQIFHGLLQSEPYMRAVFRTYSFDHEENIDKLVQARRQRTRLLKRKDASYLFVIGEAALRTILESSAILRNQLDYLLVIIRSYPNVEIRVLPFTVALSRLPFQHFVIYDERSVEIEGLKGQLDLWVEEDVKYYCGLMNYLASVSLPPLRTEEFIKDVRESILQQSDSKGDGL